MQDPVSRWLIVVAVGFVAFLLLKLRGAQRKRRDRAAWTRYHSAIARAKAAKARKEKAAAFREAAHLALGPLSRPNLAASLARRADRLDPEGDRSLELLVSTMSRGERLKALERLLWRKLKEVEPGTPRHRKIFRELLALYEGPLRSPDKAEALRELYPD